MSSPPLPLYSPQGSRLPPNSHAGSGSRCFLPQDLPITVQVDIHSLMTDSTPPTSQPPLWQARRLDSDPAPSTGGDLSATPSDAGTWSSEEYFPPVSQVTFSEPEADPPPHGGEGRTLSGRVPDGWDPERQRHSAVYEERGEGARGQSPSQHPSSQVFLDSKTVRRALSRKNPDLGDDNNDDDNADGEEEYPTASFSFATKIEIPTYTITAAEDLQGDFFGDRGSRGGGDGGGGGSWSGGGGSRLKNRTGTSGGGGGGGGGGCGGGGGGGGVGASARVMPIIAETHLRAGDKEGGVGVLVDTPAPFTPRASNNSSYSATYSSTYMASSATNGDDGGARNGGGGGGGRRGAASGKKPLTVEGTWKVEATMKAKQGRSRGSSIRKLAVAKWFTMLGMSLLLLACLMSAKLALLTLTAQLWQHLPDLGDQVSTQWSRYTAQFILLYLYLTIPPGLMWLRSVWYGLLDKPVPWPSRKAVLLTVFSAGMESLGLCLMAYSVLGRYQTPVSLLLLTAVLWVPAVNVFTLVVARRRSGRVRCFPFALVVGGVLCMTLGTVGVGYLLASTTPQPDSDLWHPAVATVCLCVAWVPSLQRYISTAVRRRKSQDPQVEASYGTFGNDNNGYETTATTTLTTTATTSTASNHHHHHPTRAANAANVRSTTATKFNIRSGDLSTNAAWKTAFIQNGCRVLFVFLFSALLFMLDSGQPPSAVLTDQVHQAFLNAWDLATFVESPDSWVAFWLGLGSSLLAYVLAFAACHMNMAKVALAPPLLLAMPLTLVVVTVTPVCQTLLPSGTCNWKEDNVQYLVPTAVCLALGHALVFGWYLFRSDPVLLLQECMVYYVPSYNGVSLDSWLTVNRRLPVSVAETGDKRRKKTSKVFICTTMYREDEEEMRQLLESIRHINETQAGGDRCFESHVIFDNGVRQRELTEFALRLISLLEDTLGIRPQACTKVLTPYGLKLSWSLPGPSGHQMPFTIHLKDNLLVKNKKRWSQVMYMSYVLDALTEADDEAFILTTDADVVFTPDSVEALLDLMTRDNSIGAVCARTHPMGGGPLIWYQVFEYAIGHWFQKTAEHALGSVLCAPGCFSVYRCRALADVLPKYAKKVETAFDFLTKDMGEDRWLCTLLVQSGWRIEYCAASENSTNCPGNFDEFYKQRRRWIASTLANLMLIVQEWKYVLLLNRRVSVVFLIYQGLLLFSTLIGPSTVMLVVSGGLSYAWLVDAVATVVVQLLACMVFCLVCIYTTQKTQLTVAKLYTFAYAMVMTAVVVGTAAQIVDDLSKSAPEKGGPSTPHPNATLVTTTLPPNQHISMDLPMSVTTLYFLGLVAIFLTAGLLHPREIHCLVHSVWYLLCLPSGYLVLPLYSISNITDSSWGTREQAAAKSAVKNVPWQDRVKEIFFEVFFCFKGKAGDSGRTSEVGVQTVKARAPSVSLSISEEVTGHLSSLVGCEDSMGAPSLVSAENDLEVLREEDMDEMPDETEPVPVEEWLPPEMRGRYVQLFKKHGFDSTLFIAGMTETELRRIGVTLKGHLRYLLDQIALIPAFEIEYKVPLNADEWLKEIGLPMYCDNFRRNHIQQPKEMEILKSMGRKEIEHELRIIKDGHIKRLKYAIAMLRDPTEAQQRAIRMRQVIDEAPIHNLADINIGENDFWESLRTKCLEPDLKAFGLEGEVKAKLGDLRNQWLMIVAVSNLLWLILITTLASNASLTLLGANPMSLVFLAVFGCLFVVQFLTMLVHRLYTLSHFLARAPYRCGRPLQSTWTFSGRDGQTRENLEDSTDYTAVRQVQRDAERAWTRVVNHKRKRKRARGPADQLEERQQQQLQQRHQQQATETSPLL